MPKIPLQSICDVPLHFRDESEKQGCTSVIYRLFRSFSVEKLFEWLIRYRSALLFFTLATNENAEERHT